MQKEQNNQDTLRNKIMETESMIKRPKMMDAALAVVPNDDFINNLPYDCLCHIFSFLTLEDRLQSLTVCKRWKDFGSEAWRDVKKLDFIILEKMKTKHRKLVALSGGLLTELTISVSKGSDMIQIVTNNCSNLTKFRVRFEDDQSDKTEHCKDLAKLFVKNREKLRSVVMDNLGKKFTDHTNCLLELPEELIELQLWGVMAHFEIDGIWGITPSPPFIPQIGRLKHLEILVLNGFILGQEAVTMIGDMENLRYLEIYVVIQLSMNIDSISSRRKLEYLSLSGINNTTDSWVNDLVDNNPDLKHLKLNGSRLSVQANQTLSRLSKLETLHLINCKFVSNSFNLSGFRNVKKLIATCISDRDIMTLMEIAPRLEFVRSDSYSNGPGLLRKAHEVASRRVNNIPLHVVLHPHVIWDWEKPESMPPLLVVESSDKHYIRTANQYTGYNVELSH